MKNNIQGRVYVLGDNIDTDQIIPAEHLVYRLNDPEERRLYGKYALSGVPPEQAGLPEGNCPFVAGGEFRSIYAIVITGKNFGCGSSREHAPFALREAGVECVVAESYARIFFRNSVNGGYLVPYETPERIVEKLRTGEEVAIDLEKNTLKNLGSGETVSLSPLGEVLPLLRAGDLFAYARQSGMVK